MVGIVRSLLHVDLAMITDHQSARARTGLSAGDDSFAADQAVLETRDVGDRAAGHDDCVLALAVGPLAVRADRAERTDEAVDDVRTGRDRDGAAIGGVAHARA